MVKYIPHHVLKNHKQEEWEQTSRARQTKTDEQVHVRKIAEYAKRPCLQEVKYQINKVYVCSPYPTEINNEFQFIKAKVDLTFKDVYVAYASVEAQAIFFLDSRSQQYFYRVKIILCNGLH